MDSFSFPSFVADDPLSSVEVDETTSLSGGNITLSGGNTGRVRRGTFAMLVLVGTVASVPAFAVVAVELGNVTEEVVIETAAFVKGLGTLVVNNGVPSVLGPVFRRPDCLFVFQVFSPNLLFFADDDSPPVAAAAAAASPAAAPAALTAAREAAKDFDAGTVLPADVLLMSVVVAGLAVSDFGVFFPPKMLALVLLAGAAAEVTEFLFNDSDVLPFPPLFIYEKTPLGVGPLVSFTLLSLNFAVVVTGLVLVVALVVEVVVEVLDFLAVSLLALQGYNELLLGPLLAIIELFSLLFWVSPELVPDFPKPIFLFS